MCEEVNYELVVTDGKCYYVYPWDAGIGDNGAAYG